MGWKPIFKISLDGSLDFLQSFSILSSLYKMTMLRLMARMRITHLPTQHFPVVQSERARIGMALDQPQLLIPTPQYRSRLLGETILKLTWNRISEKKLTTAFPTLDSLGLSSSGHSKKMPLSLTNFVGGKSSNTHLEKIPINPKRGFLLAAG